MATLTEFQKKVSGLQRTLNGANDVSNSARTRIGLLKRAANEAPTENGRLIAQAKAFEDEINWIINELRMEAIETALDSPALGLREFLHHLTPQPASPAQIAAAHTPAYIHALQRAMQRAPGYVDQAPTYVVPVAAVVIGSAAWLVANVATVYEVQQFALFGMLQCLLLAVLGWRVYFALLFPFFYLVFLVPTGEQLVPALQDQIAKLIHTSNYYHVPGQETLGPSWSSCPA